MNETLNWDDLRLFLAVARAGGLAGASGETGLSAATLGRRMLALERRLGAVLFTRHRLGYSLTETGRILLERAEALEGHALAIERWRAALEPEDVVRLAAGAWTSRFLASHAGELTAGPAPLRLEIITGVGPRDLRRREANLGIRNRRPETAGLAGRRLGQVAFALYGARSYLADNPAAFTEERYVACDWVTFAPPDARVPSADWLERRLAASGKIRCSSAPPVVDAAAAGLGLCVLPCFIGDSDLRLDRASDTIAELEHAQWLVSHDDDRHIPPIRQLSQRLARLFHRNRDLLAGTAGSGRPSGAAPA